jgi:hypothetical protein
MLPWLVQELDKLSKRSYREKEGTFTVIGYRDGSSYLFQSKPGSAYTQAANSLMEAAQRGEEIILKLPAPAASKSIYLGQPNEKLSRDVELYDVFTYNGNFGLTFIHKIRDMDGTELVWFSQDKKIEPGFYHLTAKVHKDSDKAHTEFRTTKQTRITHAKFTERKAVEA